MLLRAILISALGALLVISPAMAQESGDEILPADLTVHGLLPEPPKVKQPFKVAHPHWNTVISITKFALDVLADVALIRNGKGL